MSETRPPLPQPYSIKKGIWKTIKSVGLPALTLLGVALLSDPELTAAIQASAGTGLIGLAVSSALALGINWAKNRNK